MPRGTSCVNYGDRGRESGAWGTADLLLQEHLARNEMLRGSVTWGGCGAKLPKRVQTVGVRMTRYRPDQVLKRANRKEIACVVRFEDQETLARQRDPTPGPDRFHSAHEDYHPYSLDVRRSKDPDLWPVFYLSRLVAILSNAAV